MNEGFLANLLKKEPKPNEKIDKLNMEISELNEILNETKTENKRLTTVINNITSELIQTKKINASLQTANEEYTEKLDDTTSELKKIKTNNQKLNNSIFALSSKLTLKTNEILSLDADKRKLQLELEETKKINASLKTVNEEYTEKLDNTTSELKKIKTKFQKFNDEFSALSLESTFKTEKIQSLDANKRKLQLELEETKKINTSLKTVNEKYTEKLYKIFSELKTITYENQKLKKNNEKNEIKLKNIVQSVDNIRIKLDLSESNNELLEKKIQSEQEKNEELQSKIKEIKAKIERTVADNNELKVSLCALKTDLENKENELQLKDKLLALDDNNPIIIPDHPIDYSADEKYIKLTQDYNGLKRMFEYYEDKRFTDVSHLKLIDVLKELNFGNPYKYVNEFIDLKIKSLTEEKYNYMSTIDDKESELSELKNKNTNLSEDIKGIKKENNELKDIVKQYTGNIRTDKIVNEFLECLANITMTINEEANVNEIKILTRMYMKKMYNMLKSYGLIVLYHMPGDKINEDDINKFTNVFVKNTSEAEKIDTVAYSEIFGCYYKNDQFDMSPEKLYIYKNVSG